MKGLILSLTVLSGILGLIAAYYWLRSALVPINPPGDFEPLDEAAKANFWNAGLMGAFQKSADLNKKAAAFTGVSVLLASIAGIIAIL